MAIRVMLADDHRILREALRVCLDVETDIDVIGETGTGPETLAAIELTPPDVLVLDIGLPGINGIEVAQQVTRRHPEIRIVALSGFAEKIYVEEMLKAGVLCYVVKSAGADELFAAIRAAADRRSFFSAAVTRVLARHFASDQTDRVTPPPSVLTKREREILGQLAAGRRSAETAGKLGITLATVETHRRNIMQKLDIHSTADLTRYAVHQGLISSAVTDPALPVSR